MGNKRFRYQHYYTSSTVDQKIYEVKLLITALTTSLSSYLALAGGTLTGALISTSTIQSLSATVFGYLANISSDVQAQFTTLTASVAAKLPLAGGVLTGSLTSSSTIQGVSSTVFGYLTTLTSPVQAQLNTLTSTFASYLPLSGGALTGTLTSSSTIQGVSSTVFGYLTTLTSPVQAQLNTLTSTFASYLPLSGGALTGTLTSSSTIQGVSSTVFGYLTTLTSPVQAQLNTLTSTFASYLPLTGGTLSGGVSITAYTANLSLVCNSTLNRTTHPYVLLQNTSATSGSKMYLSTYDLNFEQYEAANINFKIAGTSLLQINNNQNAYFYGNMKVNNALPQMYITATGTGNSALYIGNSTTGSNQDNGVGIVLSGNDGTLSNFTTTGKLMFATNGSNRMQITSSGAITLYGDLTSSYNIQGISPTVLGYAGTLTSSAQAQFNALTSSLSNYALTTALSAYVPLAGGALTGALTSTSTIQGLSSTVFGYLSGVTSGVQTQLDGKIALGGTNTLTSDLVLTKATPKVTILSSNTTNPWLLMKSTTATLGSSIYVTGKNLVIMNNELAALTFATNGTEVLSFTSAGASTFAKGATFSQTVDVTGAMTCSSTIQGISSTIFGYLSSITSSVQTQLNTLTSTFASYLPLSGGTLTGIVSSPSYPITSKTYYGYIYCYGTSNGTWATTASTSLFNSSTPNITISQNVNGESGYGFNSTTGYWKVPKTGLYSITFNTRFLAADNGKNAYVVINGVKVMNTYNNQVFGRSIATTWWDFTCTMEVARDSTIGMNLDSACSCYGGMMSIVLVSTT